MTFWATPCQWHRASTSKYPAAVLPLLQTQPQGRVAKGHSHPGEIGCLQSQATAQASGPGSACCSHPTTPRVPPSQGQSPAARLVAEEGISGGWTPPLGAAACAVLTGSARRVGDLSWCHPVAWSIAPRAAAHFRRHGMLGQGLGYQKSRDRQHPEARASPLPSPAKLGEPTQREERLGEDRAKPPSRGL